MADEPEHDGPPDLSHAGVNSLSQLWPGIGLGTSGEWRTSDLGDVLRHQLAASLDLAHADGYVPPRSYGDVLLRDAPPSVEALVRVKEWAKPFMSRDDGDVPREVAGVLYFAAILAARLRAGARISDQPDDRLRKAATWALQQPWLNGTTADLFRAALLMLDRGAGPVPTPPAVGERPASDPLPPRSVG